MTNTPNRPVYIRFLPGTARPILGDHIYLYTAPKSMPLQTGDIVMVNLIGGQGMALAQVCALPDRYDGPVRADCIVLGRVDMTDCARQQKLEKEQHALMLKIRSHLSEQDVMTIARYMAPYDARLRELVVQYDDISAQLGKTMN